MMSRETGIDDCAPRRTRDGGGGEATMATTATTVNDASSAKTLVMRQTHEAVEKSACAWTRENGSRARTEGSFRSVEGARRTRARGTRSID